MRIQMKASVTERGPAARRGMQFANVELGELLEALEKARETLRLMDSAATSSTPRDDELARLRAADRAEFDRQRRQQVRLQSDLRAELRRRGAS
jgi:hypothetical protein